MLSKLYQIYEEMYQKGHSLFDYRLTDNKAATIKLNGEYAIFIDTDKMESIADELCIVAHEYGHCETGATHYISSPFDLVCKHEYKADKWAIHKILPIEDIKKAMLSGCTEVWQLAEYFNVTERFLKRAIQIYQNEEMLI